jgi:hypothetical protein
MNKMNGPELAALVTAAAIALAEGKSRDETAALGAVFSQLGDTLATLATRKDDPPVTVTVSKDSRASGSGA